MTECCWGCRTGHDVLELEIHDYGTDPNDPDFEFYCPECGAKLGIFCVRHQRLFVCLHDSSEEDEKLPHDSSACQLCALETVRQIVRPEKLEILAVFELSGKNDDFFRFAQEVGDPDVVDILDDLDTVLYGAAISAMIEGMPFADFVTAIACDGEDMTMQ